MEPRRVQFARAGSRRPLWVWLLAALAPGLVSYCCWFVLRAAAAGNSPALSVLFVPWVFMPLIALPYLLWLAGKYRAAHHEASRATTALVVGAWCLNLLVWGSSCAVTWGGLSLH